MEDHNTQVLSSSSVLAIHVALTPALAVLLFRRRFLTSRHTHACGPPLFPPQHSGYGGYSDPGVVDLWRNDAPAFGENGTGYSAHYYANETVRILEQHDLDKPLYLHLTWQNTHGPFQAPDSYMNASIDFEKRRTYYAMVAAIDDGMGWVVSHLLLIVT